MFWGMIMRCSADAVYIEIKFAHKLDAPAALGVKKDSLDIQPKRIDFVASKDNRKFELSIPLNKEVVPEVPHARCWLKWSALMKTIPLRVASCSDIILTYSSSRRFFFSVASLSSDVRFS